MIQVANSARMPFHVCGHIAFSLALNAGIRMWDGPSAGGAVVLKVPVFHRSMVTITGIMQQNPVASIFGDSKAHSIASPLCRNLCALAGIAEIAEVLQFSIIGNTPGRARSAGPTESCSQRKTLRERPQDGATFFGGKEIRTSHGTLILVPMAVDMLDFFYD